MFTSHQKVNPKEVIVGWYATGSGVSGGSALIHDFYSREMANPIHLTVDNGFTNGEASIKAYVSVSLSLGDRQLAAQFNEIPLDLGMPEAERVGFDILKLTSVDKLPDDLHGMEASMVRLLALTDDIDKYVDGVVVSCFIDLFYIIQFSAWMLKFGLYTSPKREIAADNNIGRLITDALASVPVISPSTFDELFNNRLRDNVLLIYLSSLARTQILTAEKLNAAAQIL